MRREASRLGNLARQMRLLFAHGEWAGGVRPCSSDASRAEIPPSAISGRLRAARPVAPTPVTRVVHAGDIAQRAGRLRAGEVKRLGDEPVVVELMCENAKIEVAASAKNHTLVMGLSLSPPPAS